MAGKYCCSLRALPQNAISLCCMCCVHIRIRVTQATTHSENWHRQAAQSVLLVGQLFFSHFSSVSLSMQIEPFNMLSLQCRVCIVHTAIHHSAGAALPAQSETVWQQMTKLCIQKRMSPKCVEHHERKCHFFSFPSLLLWVYLISFNNSLFVAFIRRGNMKNCNICYSINQQWNCYPHLDTKKCDTKPQMTSISARRLLQIEKLETDTRELKL